MLRGTKKNVDANIDLRHLHGKEAVEPEPKKLKT